MLLNEGGCLLIEFVFDGCLNGFDVVFYYVDLVSYSIVIVGGLYYFDNRIFE